MRSNSRLVNSVKATLARITSEKLRRKAECRLKELLAGIDASTDGGDALRLVQELEVLHQVELELQSEELREARAQVDAACKEFEDLYQNAPCGYHSLNAKGVFVRINDTELRWLGYSRDDVIGQLKLSDLLPAADRAKFREFFRREIETGATRDVFAQFRRKDGSLLPVLANSSVIRDAQGRFVATRSTLTDMTAAAKFKHKLTVHAQRIKELSSRLVALQEEERRGFAEALHAQTSPNFAALKINLEMIRADLAATLSPEIVARIDDSIALLKDTAAGIHETCTNLRPPLLDYAGLGPALDELIGQFAKRTGVRVKLSAPDSMPRLSPAVESGLFRIAQEALTNCAKHSEAKAVNVALMQRADRCTLVIADDGVGFDPGWLGDSVRARGLGLLNMRERAEFIGGTFSLMSKPAHGTRIEITLSPLPGELAMDAAAQVTQSLGIPNIGASKRR